MAANDSMESSHLVEMVAAGAKPLISRVVARGSSLADVGSLRPMLRWCLRPVQNSLGKAAAHSMSPRCKFHVD
eukprot:11656269-Karenia_brevis.AAC.1